MTTERRTPCAAGVPDQSATCVLPWNPMSMMSPTFLRPLFFAALAVLSLCAFAQEKQRMSHTASGSFTVEMKPLGDTSTAEGVSLGRMSLNKKFEGDLVGTAQGEMLTAITPVQGSAGYVAMERVVGRLNGKAGAFVLQHGGTMHEGTQSLSIGIVPGSGTGELAGIQGVFKLVITGGKHLYTLEYSMPQ
ncbi:DUF3224 domain-containing protein [Rubrivivax sp. RP6-9]|uniref:DUF3224 domain-containing protein n=1 Tax=Rubrivivax sp. RP6-9 TaxID=3415750 RepID=UPI003CC61E7F